MGSTSGAGGSAGGGATWSREFQLLQERKRLSTWGITSYEIHKSSGKIVFPRFNDLYQCLDNGYDVSKLESLLIIMMMLMMIIIIIMII